MNLVLEIFSSSILAATPVLLAALGGLYTYHANIFNIAMEGMLLISAFMAVVGSYLFGSWFAGLLLGIIGGLFTALIFILFAVYLKTDEFVTGIAINMLALGGTTYALRQMFHVKGAFISSDIVGIPSWSLGPLSRIPYVGEIVSGHPFITYVAILFVFLVSFHLYRTPFGLRLRASGEDASAVDSMGINVKLLKSKSILISGFFCGLGGVSLSLGMVRLFAENMTNGRGWISLAVIILTKGKPVNILIMALVFGLFDGMGLSLQNTAIPSQLTQMLPYLATLAALYTYSRRKTL